MTAERRPLQPVKGLSPTDLPGPPQRRRHPEGAASAIPVAAPSPAAALVGASSDAARLDTEVRAISLSLPIGLRQAVKAHARTHNITQADTVMDAVLHQYDRLSQLLAANATAGHDALFVRSRTTNHDEPFASLSLRMHTRNVNTLDELTRIFGAASRSHLCAAALAAELTTH